MGKKETVTFVGGIIRVAIEKDEWGECSAIVELCDNNGVAMVSSRAEFVGSQIVEFHADCLAITVTIGD